MCKLTTLTPEVYEESVNYFNTVPDAENHSIFFQRQENFNSLNIRKKWQQKILGNVSKAKI